MGINLRLLLLTSSLFALASFTMETTVDYEADYVVIGMGAAGAEIARLLANEGFLVIGLEAGGDHDNDVPIKDSAFAPVLEEDFFPNYFYQLSQVRQPNAPFSEFNYTTGRLLGGGTAINGQQYVEGTDENYLRWQSLLGAPWTVSNIHQAFINIENYNCVGSCPNRGHAGLLDIRQAPVMPSTPAQDFVGAVTAALGYPEINDYNLSATELGPFTRWQLTQKPNGQRESSSTAFLKPNTNDKLRILDKTTALKILFDGKTAIGVSVLRDGKHNTVCARRKVIVSAGIYSPWLLQVSGVGPADVLNDAGVKIVAENPEVGQHLINHLTTLAIFENSFDPGPPSDPNALYDGGAFLPDPFIYQPNPTSSKGQRGVQLIGINSGNTFVIGIIALQPKSLGTVKIQSGDPLQIPLVDDAAFTDPLDLATYAKIFTTYIGPIAANMPPNYTLVSPTPAVINDPTLLNDYILNNLEHTHHWTSTCRMGTSLANGVVDKFGNVLGVSNLVVADASIAPFIPDGNTQAVTYMIGKIIVQSIIKNQ